MDPPLSLLEYRLIRPIALCQCGVRSCAYRLRVRVFQCVAIHPMEQKNPIGQAISSVVETGQPLRLPLPSSSGSPLFLQTRCTQILENSTRPSSLSTTICPLSLQALLGPGPTLHYSKRTIDPLLHLHLLHADITQLPLLHGSGSSIDCYNYDSTQLGNTLCLPGSITLRP